ncbi:MAG: extracellular solute-binding protein family 1 [Paenibacillus sp.]|jgi:multiple sugar transport system substrate-binding protein|nr:extracellular solute-binding protein family 1 [Paenibacillus sp.]
MRKRNGISVRLTLALVLAGVSASGCSSTAGNGTPAADSDDSAKNGKPGNTPVELTVVGTVLAEDEFAKFVAEPMRQKFPATTIHYVQKTAAQLSDLVTANQPIDLYMDGVLNLVNFQDLRLDYDLTNLVKQQHFDLSRVQSDYITALADGTGRKDMIGLPIFGLNFALFYNKTVFDRFAVPYPKDGMTWEQARDLAVRLTRNESGVQYYGLWADNVYRGAYQLGLSWVDTASNKALFQTIAWKELFSFWYDLHKAIGYAPKGVNMTKEFTDGRLAMMAGSTTQAATFAKLQDLDWDVVAYPQNSKAPGVGQRINGFYLLLTNTGKNKEAAFRVIDTVLSNEVQKSMSRNTRISVLNDVGTQNELGKDIPALAGKNMAAFTKLKTAKMYTLGNVNAATFVNNAFNDVLYSGKDINTAINAAQEATDKALQDLKKKGE